MVPIDCGLSLTYISYNLTIVPHANPLCFPPVGFYVSNHMLFVPCFADGGENWWVAGYRQKKREFGSCGRSIGKWRVSESVCLGR
jgi:hypothetical protein